jgi:proteasome beta subunit
MEYKGTTTIGIICRDGIVLATERRATMGHFIASQEAKKVYQIDDNIGLTMAGSVGDAQILIRWIQSEIKYYKMSRGKSMSVKNVSTLLSNILHNSQSLSVSLIVGGKDKDGYSINSLDSIGGLIEEKSIVSTGSGSPMAYGVLEDQYNKDISIEIGINLAVRALNAAKSRDAGSGGVVNVITITDNGYHELTSNELTRYS